MKKTIILPAIDVITFAKTVFLSAIEVIIFASIIMIAKGVPVTLYNFLMGGVCTFPITLPVTCAIIMGFEAFNKPLKNEGTVFISPLAIGLICGYATYFI